MYIKKKKEKRSLPPKMAPEIKGQRQILLAWFSFGQTRLSVNFIVVTSIVIELFVSLF